MFHIPAHKNVSAPAGQTTLKDLVEHTEQQIKKEEQPLGHLLEVVFKREQVWWNNATEAGVFWDVVAEQFLREVEFANRQQRKNYVSSKP